MANMSLGKAVIADGNLASHTESASFGLWMVEAETAFEGFDPFLDLRLPNILLLQDSLPACGALGWTSDVREAWLANYHRALGTAPDLCVYHDEAEAAASESLLS